MLTLYWIPRPEGRDSTPRLKVRGENGGNVEVGPSRIDGGLKFQFPENEVNKLRVRTAKPPWYTEIPNNVDAGKDEVEKNWVPPSEEEEDAMTTAVVQDVKVTANGKEVENVKVSKEEKSPKEVKKNTFKKPGRRGGKKK